MKPLKTRRLLAEHVADRIREAILAGRLHQGERLVEARFAEQLGVSRGPLREAFKLLRAEGLVREEPHRGTFVTSLTGGDVREIDDLRAAIEGRAAKLLADAGRPADMRALRRLLDDVEDAAHRADARATAEADLAFHDAVRKLCNNRRLHDVFVRHVPLLQSLMKLDEQLYGTLDDAAFEHEPMVAAITDGEADLAAERFEAHIDRARDLVAAYLDGRAGAPLAQP